MPEQMIPKAAQTECTNQWVDGGQVHRSDEWAEVPTGGSWREGCAESDICDPLIMATVSVAATSPPSMPPNRTPAPWGMRIRLCGEGEH